MSPPGTRTIRVGAGGIMLPNHSPLVIAEQFGTLESLFPGRIDLGLGRAPGSDQTTAQALRRNLASDPEQFPQDVMELMGYFATGGARSTRHGGPRGRHSSADLDPGFQPVRRAGRRGAGPAVCVRIAFRARHDACRPSTSTAPASEPSAQLERPLRHAGFQYLRGQSDAQARFLSTSMQQAFVNLRSGRPDAIAASGRGISTSSCRRRPRRCSRMCSSCSAIGSPDTVRSALKAFIERTGPTN